MWVHPTFYHHHYSRKFQIQSTTQFYSYTLTPQSNFPESYALSFYLVLYFNFTILISFGKFKKLMSLEQFNPNLINMLQVVKDVTIWHE